MNINVSYDEIINTNVLNRMNLDETVCVNNSYEILLWRCHYLTMMQ